MALSGKELESLAREIAESMQFSYLGNFGRGEFTYKVKANASSAGAAKVWLRAECNAQITLERARNELNLLLKSIAAKHAAARRSKVKYYGYWHMGNFRTQGVECEVWVQ